MTLDRWSPCSWLRRRCSMKSITRPSTWAWAKWLSRPAKTTCLSRGPLATKSTFLVAGSGAFRQAQMRVTVGAATSVTTVSSFGVAKSATIMKRTAHKSRSRRKSAWLTSSSKTTQLRALRRKSSQNLCHYCSLIARIGIQSHSVLFLNSSNS